MNLPYETAAEAVEFWRECAEVLDDSPGVIPELMIEVHFTSDEDLEAFTRDMLARCVLWLYSKGLTLHKNVDEGFHLPYYNENSMFVVHDFDTNCIITAHRDAVLAVAKETTP